MRMWTQSHGGFVTSSCPELQVGLIMYFVRTPCEWGMDAISATLTFLWEVVGYVEGLFFKDLKQTMKKEQCEVKLLVTASMPGTDFRWHNFSKSMNTPFTDQVSLSFMRKLANPGIECLKEFLLNAIWRNTIDPLKVSNCQMKKGTSEQRSTWVSPWRVAKVKDVFKSIAEGQLNWGPFWMDFWHCKENNIVCMAWTPGFCELTERWLYEKLQRGKSRKKNYKTICSMIKNLDTVPFHFG